jgi:hypothetical protein
VLLPLVQTVLHPLGPIYIQLNSCRVLDVALRQRVSAGACTATFAGNHFNMRAVFSLHLKWSDGPLIVLHRPAV